MTRDQQLAFCKKCTNRTMDLQQGLLCTLTGAKADFTDQCPSFVRDENVKETFDNTTPLDPQDVRSAMDEQVFEKLRLEQNLPMGTLAAASAGVVGAALWALITVITEYQIGYMALAIGAMVGFTMRFVGKGIDPAFGITGAFLAVVSCLLGNFLGMIGFASIELDTGYFETLLLFDYSYFIPVMTESFSPIDLLFYGIAGYEGYKFSFRVFTQQDVAELQQGD